MRRRAVDCAGTLGRAAAVCGPMHASVRTRACLPRMHAATTMLLPPLCQQQHCASSTMSPPLMPSLQLPKNDAAYGPTYGLMAPGGGGCRAWRRRGVAWR